MTYRERFDAIMHYKNYDRLPIVHFGFWKETIVKWKEEGHLTQDEIQPYIDRRFVYYGDPAETNIADKLGFDHCYHDIPYTKFGPFPPFPPKPMGVTPQEFTKTLNPDGVVEMHKDGGSAKCEIDHLMKDRDTWDNQFKSLMQYTPERTKAVLAETMPMYQALQEERQVPIGLHCGSLFGKLRDIVGLEEISYLYADDEDLLIEMIDTQGELCYQNARAMLETGFHYDFGHFWEDIACTNGPLVPLDLFDKHCGKHYRRIADLLNSYGIDIISVDCDGCVDKLIPTWINNGINTIFPIEVGTWNASIAPFREKYGTKLRGVGGMRKAVLGEDYAAIDMEIERLKPLVELGGYLPCPDHLISPEAKWENVQYYCEKMHKTFAG